VTVGESLISELGAVDAFPAGAVSPGEIPSLTHELRDDAVEHATTEVQQLPTSPHALLPSAQSSEVFLRPWDVWEQLKHDPPGRSSTYGDVEEDTIAGHY
jgi:hypothetical protein